MLIDRKIRAVLSVAAISLLAACSGVSSDGPNVPARNDADPTWKDAGKGGSLFGPGGLFGSSATREINPDSEIGVNSFLWRASLDTMAFMPLASADPFGGVIITDWYAPPERPNERFKMSIFIMDRALRADGIRVSVFRQVRDQSGVWSDAAVEPKTATDLENAILTRARQLRSAATAQSKD